MEGSNEPLMEPAGESRGREARAPSCFCALRKVAESMVLDDAGLLAAEDAGSSLQTTTALSPPSASVWKAQPELLGGLAEKKAAAEDAGLSSRLKSSGLRAARADDDCTEAALVKLLQPDCGRRAAAEGGEGPVEKELKTLAAGCALCWAAAFSLSVAARMSSTMESAGD
jgi:hypothetical protein